MSSKDGVQGTLLVAFLLCVICSIIVSTAAVVLKPIQITNKALDKQKNILAAAGMLPSGDVSQDEVVRIFDQIEKKVIDLSTGEYVEGLDNFDARKSSKDPAQSTKLSSKEDIAGIRRRSNLAEVYLVRGDAGNLNKIILPVHGYGLWSTLYGFLALENDANTIAGLGFYEHAETPGLGGEVDNPKWKQQWPGKAVYEESGEVAISLAKGAEGKHEVDALSGATLTSRGVENLLHYWMSEQGYKPFLAKLASSGV